MPDKFQAGLGRRALCPTAAAPPPLAPPEAVGLMMGYSSALQHELESRDRCKTGEQITGRSLT
jgi:hypothetical protein